MIDFELETRLDHEALAEIALLPEIRRVARRTWFSRKAVVKLEARMKALLEIKRPFLSTVPPEGTE